MAVSAKGLGTRSTCGRCAGATASDPATDRHNSRTVARRALQRSNEQPYKGLKIRWGWWRTAPTPLSVKRQSDAGRQRSADRDPYRRRVGCRTILAAMERVTSARRLSTPDQGGSATTTKAAAAVVGATG